MRSHLFDLSDPSLNCEAIGNNAVWSITLRHVCDLYQLDGFVVPPAHTEDYHHLWRFLFGCDRVFRLAAQAPACDGLSRPGEREKQHALQQPSIFECAAVESGFALPPGPVHAPLIWPCNSVPRNRVMVYPREMRQANRYFDLGWWRETLRQMRRSWLINHLGTPAAEHRDLVNHEFPATLAGLGDCVAASTVAVGTSTGPSWALLLSNIPQVLLDQPREIEQLWSFRANRTRVEKPWRIYDGKEMTWLSELPSISNTVSATAPTLRI